MRHGVYSSVLLTVTFFVAAIANGAVQQDASKGRRTVVVLWFEDKTGDARAAHWRYTATQLVTRSLANVKAVRMLLRTAVEFPFRQLKLNAGATLDVAQARKMGQLVEAQRVVWGNYRRDGDKWQITARVLNVATGKASPELSVASADWLEMRDKLTEQIIEELIVAPSEEERRKMALRPTTSSAALELFSRAYALHVEKKAASEQEAMVRKALAADPQFAEAHAFLAGILGNQGKFEPADQAVRNALKIKPDDGKMHAVLGFLLVQQGRLADSEREFREAHRVDPDDPDPLTWLAQLYFAQNKFDEAITYLEQARRLDATNGYVHALLGIAYTDKRDPARATAELREAQRFGPEDTNSEYAIAQAYDALGETARAVEHYEKAITAHSCPN